MRTDLLTLEEAREVQKGKQKRAVLRLSGFLVLLSCFLLFACTACAGVPSGSGVHKRGKAAISAETSANSEEKIPVSFLLSSIETKGALNNYRAEYFYDEENRLIRQIDSQNGAVYCIRETAYDAAGAIVKTRYAVLDGSGNETIVLTESFSYSEDGKKIGSVTDNNGTVRYSSYSYDDNGRLSLISETDDSGASVGEKRYVYLDEFGSYELTFSNGMKETTVYDALGRESETSSADASGSVYQSAINEYDEQGNLKKSTDQNGAVYEYVNEYKDGRLVSVEVRNDGEFVKKTEYVFDEYGNVVTEKETNAAGTVTLLKVNEWTPVYGK